MDQVPSARRQLFPSTRWTLIRRAQGDELARKRALDELLCLYWQPLLRLALLRGLAPERAADAVQDFALRLLEDGQLIARLDPTRGRLRSFLRTAFGHHLENLHTRANAQKRGGGYQILSLDLGGLEPAADAGQNPDAAYDREWARRVMERALAALRAEFGTGARTGPFEVLENYFQVGEPPARPGGEGGEFRRRRD